MNIEVQNRVDKIQAETHNMVGKILNEDKTGKISYQDATNVILMHKIAELQLKIENIEKSISNATIIKERNCD